MNDESPANIVAFRQMVLLVAQQLYEKLPTPIDLDPLTLDQKLIPVDASFDETFDRFGVAADTIRWLAHEGFLRYDSQDISKKFHNLVLSKQGLALLESASVLPSSGGKPTSFIDRVRKAAKESGGKVAVDLAAKLVAELIKGLAS